MTSASDNIFQTSTLSSIRKQCRSKMASVAADAQDRICFRFLMGPVLLIIFINDIVDVFADSNVYIKLFADDVNHRLCGSASPVLTATHHSYGSPRLSDFFFRLTPGGQTPQPI